MLMCVSSILCCLQQSQVKPSQVTAETWFSIIFFYDQIYGSTQNQFENVFTAESYQDAL